MQFACNLLNRSLGLLIASGLLLLAGCSSSGGLGIATTPTSASQAAPSSPASWETISLSKLLGTEKVFLFYAVSPVDPETIHACTTDGSSPSQHPIRLWRTHDAGQHWSALSLPASAGTGCTISIARSQPQRIAFLATNTSDNQRPCDQDMLYLSQAFQSGNGRQWTPLPPLPAPGTSTQQPGLLQALAVTDDGRFLAFGVNPRTGLPSHLTAGQELMSTFWLWIWNPHIARWQVLSPPLNHPESESCGLCWDAQLSTGSEHTTYLYVYHWDDGNPIFRVRLPAV